MPFILMGITMWNHWQITARCIKSIREHTDLRGVRLVIFDNGSDDLESQKWLETCGEEVYRIGENTGCCGSIRNMFNFSYTLDEIEFVCPLCPDLLVTEGWLDRLVDIMRLKEELILVAPKDNNNYHVYQEFKIPQDVQPVALQIEGSEYGVRLFEEDDSKLQEYVKREFYDKRKHPAFVIVPSVDIPISLWRKSYVKELGGFDERLDYALGDIEMMVRISRSPYRIGYCLSSFIYHHSHGASGLYEGYAKKFKKHLNDYATDAMTFIRGIHGVDVADYGGLKGIPEEKYLEIEKNLVKRE